MVFMKLAIGEFIIGKHVLSELLKNRILNSPSSVSPDIILSEYYYFPIEFMKNLSV